MNDFAVHIDYYFHKHEGAAILSELDYDLSEIPCGPLGYGQPRELDRELFVGAV